MLEITKQGTCNNDPLDLVSSFKNLGDFTIAHIAFNGIVVYIARSSKNLYSVGSNFHRRIGSETFRHRSVHSGTLSSIQSASSLMNKHTRGLDLHSHVSQH